MASAGVFTFSVTNTNTSLTTTVASSGDSVLIEAMSPIADGTTANNVSAKSDSIFADAFESSAEENGYTLENNSLSDGLDQDCSLCK